MHNGAVSGEADIFETTNKFEERLVNESSMFLCTSLCSS